MSPIRRSTSCMQRKLLLILLAFLLSGVAPLLANLTPCGVMPCCANQATIADSDAPVTLSTTDCCVIKRALPADPSFIRVDVRSAASTETSSIAGVPFSLLPPTASLFATLAFEPSPPPRQRLATLSVLRI